MTYALFRSSLLPKFRQKGLRKWPSGWFSAINLKSRSKLFTMPKNGICVDAESFILGLNTLVVAQSAKINLAHPKKDISESISKGGVISWHAEMLHFGLWLLVEGQPGKLVTRGPQPDAESILRVVAVASALLFQREAYLQAVDEKVFHNIQLSARKSKKAKSKKITSTDMAMHWQKMFLQRLPATNFTSRMKSAHKSLDCYLVHLRNRRNKDGDLECRSSKHLRSVLKAISQEPVKLTTVAKTVRQS
jgi:hypothetical protein